MERFVKAIEEHTKALLAHAEALAKVGLAKAETAIEGKAKGRPAKGETNGVADPIPTQAAAGMAQSAQTGISAVSTATAIGSAAPAGLLSAKALSDLFVGTAKLKGRDYAVNALRQFNVATLDKITADKQAEFIAVLNGKLPEAATVTDDLSSLLG